MIQWPPKWQRGKVGTRVTEHFSIFPCNLPTSPVFSQTPYSVNQGGSKSFVLLLPWHGLVTRNIPKNYPEEKKKKNSKTIKRQLKTFNCLKDLRINYDFNKTVYATCEIVKVKYPVENCQPSPMNRLFHVIQWKWFYWTYAIEKEKKIYVEKCRIRRVGPI